MIDAHTHLEKGDLSVEDVCKFIVTYLMIWRGSGRGMWGRRITRL